MYTQKLPQKLITHIFCQTKIRLLKGSSSSRHTISLDSSLFFGGRKDDVFLQRPRPSEQKILSGRVRTSSKPLVMRRRIPPSAAWPWRCVWVGCPIGGFWWGNFRKRTSPKRKVRFQGNLPWLFQKKILVKYMKYSIWPDVMCLYHSRRWCSNILQFLLPEKKP